MIGDTIRALRKAKKLTQPALAERAHTDATHISRIERGHLSPSLDLLRRIAAALDVPAARLLVDEDAPYCPDDPALQRLAAAWPSLPPEKRAALATLAEERGTYTTDELE
jgi:transcriptional regulator with XRE-family HTH domain